MGTLAMLSRLKRLTWSLGFTLSLGLAFVPLGCGSSVTYTSVFPRHRDAEVPEVPARVVEQLTGCVNEAPASLKSTDAKPATYAIQYNVHVTTGGVVSSVEVKDSMLGGDAIEACMAGVLQGATLPVGAMAAQRAPQSRAFLASPALVLAPVSLAPVVITGVGIIVLVAVVVYIASDTSTSTRDPTDEDSEKERCKKIKRMCIDRCIDAELPTYKNDGMPYHNCIRECLEAHDCWGKIN